MGLLFGIATLLYYFWVPKKYDWSVSYDHQSYEPYGFGFLGDIFEENDSITIVEDDLALVLDTLGKNQKYIYLNSYLLSDSREMDLVFSWVERGNEAVIIVDEVPIKYLMRLSLGKDSIQKIEKTKERLDSIFQLQETAVEQLMIQEVAPDTTADYYHSERAQYDRFLTAKYSWEEKDTNSQVSITSVGYKETVPLFYRVREDTINWSYHANGFTYVSHTAMDTNLEGYQPLGFIDEGRIVDFRVLHGEGSFRFHLLPMAFTNIHIAEANIWEYDQWVLGELRDTNYYDPTLHQFYQRDDFQFSGGLDSSPLYFILDQPPLKWAWYILLGTVLVYFLFKLKRERSEIPVLKPNPNASLEFAKAIGFLRRGENDLFAIADEMYVAWEATLRKSFRTPDPEKTLLGVGYIAKFPEAAKEVQSINNYKQKLISEQNLEAYEVKIIHNLFVSIYNRIAQ